MQVVRPSRRALFALGGAALAAGFAAASFCRQRRTSKDDAYAPWRRWNDPALEKTPLALVAAAALAANPHDTQPGYSTSAPTRSKSTPTSRATSAQWTLSARNALRARLRDENMMTAASRTALSRTRGRARAAADRAERATSLQRSCI